jgi:dephospho-CoA kinase
MKRVPIIGVTGPIASGKTTVARFIAGTRGVLIDCDSLGHRALEYRDVRDELVAAFGNEVLAPSGAISRKRLSRFVFASDRALARLNRIMRPPLKRIITEEVLRDRARALYIVLDAVLLFQYKFSFKVDCVVVTGASLETRLKRIMRRDGVSRAEALRRIERQRELHDAWTRADVRMSTDRSLSKTRSKAIAIRDRFLARYGATRRNVRCTKNRIIGK